MKLSLKLISLGLTRGHVQIVSTRTTHPDQMRLQSLMLWNKNETWDYSVCYVLDAEEITPDFHCPDNIALIILGHTDSARFRKINADVMVWDVDRTEMNLRDQFNHLTSVFWYYQDMETRLLRRLMDSTPLQELLTFGQGLFRNPLLLLDSGFSLLFKSRKEIPLEWDLSGPGHIPSLPADTVEQIRLSSEFRSREQNGGIFALSNEILNTHALMIQVQRDQLTFYLAVLENGVPLLPAHVHLLQLFSEYVFFALRSRRFSNAKTMHFEDLVRRMLQEESAPMSQIDRQLHALHWKNHDRYLCFVLELDLWNRKDIDAYSICRMVENKFPDTFAFYHADRIICITNLDHAGLRQDVFLHLLAPYVRDHLFRSGVSYEFRDFSSFVNFYHQALAALDFGKQRSPDEWSHRFDKYALDYFTRYGTSRMDAKYLCHPDLILLKQYDQENNTNLLQTLRAYLNCGQNATTTAAELYIHRNTLYQRLTRIESLIHGNLADPNTRLYMQISFSMMDFSPAVPS